MGYNYNRDWDDLENQAATFLDAEGRTRRFNYQDETYLAAKKEAFRRTYYWCAYCGRARAEEAHHWRGYEAGPYLAEKHTTADELIPLCGLCHEFATFIRSNPFSAPIRVSQKDIDAMGRTLLKLDQISEDEKETLVQGLTCSQKEQRKLAKMSEIVVRHALILARE